MAHGPKYVVLLQHLQWRVYHGWAGHVPYAQAQGGGRT